MANEGSFKKYKLSALYRAGFPAVPAGKTQFIQNSKPMKTIIQSLAGIMNKISLWFELLAPIIAVTILQACAGTTGTQRAEE